MANEIVAAKRKKCKRHKPDKLSYLQAFADADRRLKNKERQIQCNICKFWFWQHEF